MFSDLDRKPNCVGTAFKYRGYVQVDWCGIAQPTLGDLYHFCNDERNYQYADFVVAVANVGHWEPEFLQVYHMIAVAWSNPSLYVHRPDEGWEVEYDVPYEQAMRHHSDLTVYQHIGLAVVRSKLGEFVEYYPRKAR